MLLSKRRQEAIFFSGGGRIFERGNRIDEWGVVAAMLLDNGMGAQLLSERTKEQSCSAGGLYKGLLAGGGGSTVVEQRGQEQSC